MSAWEEDRRGLSGLTTSWSRRFRTAPVAGYLDMIDELRHRLDTIAARPALACLDGIFAPHGAPEMPGRTQTMSPRLMVDSAGLWAAQ
jgi:hypothetical protein